MNSLAEIKSAIDALSPEDKAALYRHIQNLAQVTTDAAARPALQSLDRPPVSLGAVLRPFDSHDDLLGEMLESRGI